jgi:hypothetical protein
MATVSTNERNAIVDMMFTVAGEDYQLLGHLLDFVQTGLTGITWSTIMRTRAANWAPYIASGLSITWFVDETIRYAANYASQR